MSELSDVTAEATAERKTAKSTRSQLSHTLLYQLPLKP